MLVKESLFDELLKVSKTSVEKNLIKELFDLIRNFYYVLDIYNECNINLKIFNYLFSDLAIYKVDEIAAAVYVSDRTIKRFKRKTERIIITLIKTNEQYEILNQLLQKHKNA